MKKLSTLLLAALFTINLYAQKNEEPVISLTGTAKQYILPDLATLNLVVQAEGTDEGKVLQKVQETAKHVSNRMKDFGINKEQVKLTDFSLEEKYIHKKNEGRFKVGYIGQQTVRIKIPIDSETISKFIEYISNNKLKNTAINFTTELSESLEEKTRLHLIEKALQNARLQAELIAKTNGLIITGVAKIGHNEEEPNIRFTRPVIKYDEEEIPDELSFETSITSLLSIEEIEVGEAVSVVYRIKNK